MRKLFTGVVAASTVTVLLSSLYRGGLLAYIETMQASDYSYLLLLAPLALYLALALSTRNGLRGAGVDVSRLTALLSAVFFSTLLYALSRMLPEYSLQLEILSVVTLSSSVVLYAYSGFRDWKTPLAVWLLFLALTPLPRSVLDVLAAILTEPTVIVASLLSGAQAGVDSNGYTVLVFRDAGGVLRRLQVAPVCSGISSLLTVLALVPLIAYVVSGSPAPRRSKILFFTGAVGVGALIVFLGNALRIALIVHLARTSGYEAAMLLAHQTPALVYAALATLASLYTATRLPGGKKEPRETMVEARLVTLPDVVKTAILVAVVLFHVALTATITGTAVNAAEAGWKLAPQVDAEKLLSKPSSILFNNTGFRVTGFPSPLLGEALGALSVQRITLRAQGLSAVGYVEIAETPSRFHQWQVCLTSQGYIIEKWWSETLNTSTVTFALVKGRAGSLLLAYTIYQYPTSSGPLYVRISLFTHASTLDMAQKAALLARILEEAKPPSQKQASLDTLTWTAYAGLLAAIIAPITRIKIARSMSQVTFSQRL